MGYGSDAMHPRRTNDGWLAYGMFAALMACATGCGGGGGGTATIPPDTGKNSTTGSEHPEAVGAPRSIAGHVVANGDGVQGAIVAVGRKVYGDASSLHGPAELVEDLVILETVTDETGAFRFDEVPAGELALVAEAPGVGRSRGTVIKLTSGSMTDLSVELLAYGSLSGAVLFRGTPQPDVIVQTQTRAAPGVIFAVQTNELGVYRLDKLAPGDYRIVAVIPMSPSLHYYSATGSVASKAHTAVDVAVTPGTDVLFVALRPRGGKQAQVSFVYLLEGEHRATTTLELNEILGELGDRFSALGFSEGGAPAVIERLLPGTYTTCAIPFPAELETIQDTIAYREREGDNMKMFCRPVVLDGSQPELSVAVDIDVPVFVPAPETRE